MKNASQLPEFQNGYYDTKLVNESALRRAIRRSWLKHFGVKCQVCDCEMLFDQKHQEHERYATFDHIVAQSLGGSNSPDNLQVICRECNNHKSKEEGRKCQQEKLK